MSPITLLLVSTADTDLLAARAADAGYRVANPARLSPDELPALLDGVDAAVVRLLGGARVWEAGLAALARAGVPTVALGGEAVPDADLMALSSVPVQVVAHASRFLAAGGPDNLGRLARYLDAAVRGGDQRAEPEPVAQAPEFGIRAGRAADPARPTVGVVYYRAHELSGNTAFVDGLCDAVEAAGGQRPSGLLRLPARGRAGGRPTAWWTCCADATRWWPRCWPAAAPSRRRRARAGTRTRGTSACCASSTCR